MGYGLLSCTRSLKRIVDSLVALVDHAGNQRKTELGQDEKHQAEYYGHPEQKTGIWKHQIHRDTILQRGDKRGWRKDMHPPREHR